MTRHRQTNHTLSLGRRNGGRWAACLGLLLLPVLAQQVTGCMSVEQMAPPIDGGFSAFAVSRGLRIDMLEGGRRVYLTDCSRCHSIEPIARYSKRKWQSILPRMCEESKLDGVQSEAVTAYILATCDLLALRADAERAQRADESAGK